MFLVEKNTAVTVVRPSGEEVEYITQKDNFFEKGEVVIDPLFNLGPAAGALYGFECEETGFALYVDQKHVTYLD
jgi:hypothetical protein